MAKITVQQISSLAKKIRKKNQSWLSAIKEASRQLKSGKKKVGATLLLEKRETKRTKPKRIVRITRKGNGTFKTMKQIGSVHNIPANREGKMLARIAPLGYVYVGYPGNEKLRTYLKQMAGQWVEIETNHLFDNQYNTTDGYRIYDTMIDRIYNDARKKMNKCSYCGEMVRPGDHHKKYPQCDVERFTPANTSFLAWGGVKPAVKQVKKKEFGSYTLETVNDHYRLRNARQRIDFLTDGKNIWTSTGIGYGRNNNLAKKSGVYYPVPAQVATKIRKYILNYNPF